VSVNSGDGVRRVVLNARILPRISIVNCTTVCEIRLRDSVLLSPVVLLSLIVINWALPLPASTTFQRRMMIESSSHCKSGYCSESPMLTMFGMRYRESGSQLVSIIPSSVIENKIKSPSRSIKRVSPWSIVSGSGSEINIVGLRIILRLEGVTRI